ncbi:WXG100 family type VII secretion target [Pseudobutyrivibrio sp. 49]|uniref:WXG100 family type VII secretion target n=1 Tax=unclassified Pseudobutyrivibrio TaxID=2638619 RepID=UPI00088AECD1|nr:MULTISPECIES: WXG100 family type VII secretion target [unclassified Pseudobutyrivibrio]SDI36147.1 WXG100 family type VII secretion target [Pseudobutyrivibrio sp. 49]SFN94781.1 WXG100 family type VII secretion target [Pseudobutyrivibrio sp. UC1225]
MLYIDNEAIQTAKDQYYQHELDMDELKVDLETAITELRKSWKSDAGDKFFEKFDDQWVKNMSDYIVVLQHMQTNLNTAKTKYQDIYDEAGRLNL